MRLKVHSDQLAVGLVFVAVGVLAGLAPMQSDSWWLLRAGRDIWTTGSVPLVDAYSHTAAGGYWWNHEWLAEAVFYALFRVGGLPLLTAATAAAIFAAWALSWRLTRGRFDLRFLVFSTCMAAAAASWAVRPQAFSMLLFVIACWLLAHPARLKWVPLVVLLWINVHGAGVLALVAIAGAGVGEALRLRTIPWRMTAVFAASFVATGLSPIGFRMYPEILASVERSRLNQLIEWLPPDASPLLWPFWALVVALPVTIAMRARDIDDRSARLLGIAAAVLPLAVRSTRNVHIFLLVAIPAITCAWAGRRPVPRRTAGERPVVNGWILTAAAIGGLAFVLYSWSLPAPRLGWRPIDPSAVRAIQGCPGPLYNTYGDGGILIWFVPDRPVFIDNRQDPYPTEILRLNRTLEIQGDYRAVFERYGIQCAALPPGSPVTGNLRSDAAWTVRHQDADWVIFYRR